jgi:hypothetical protein
MTLSPSLEAQQLVPADACVVADRCRWTAERTMRRIRVVLLALAFTASLGVARAEDRGRLCLAVVPASTSGTKSLSNPTGGNPNAQYTVKIDGATPVELSRSTARWVEGLSLSKPHTVVISADGKRIESFRFDFGAQKTEKLTLFLAPLYMTWQLWPAHAAASWSGCADAPAAKQSTSSDGGARRR